MVNIDYCSVANTLSNIFQIWVAAIRQLHTHQQMLKKKPFEISGWNIWMLAEAKEEYIANMYVEYVRHSLKVGEII
jgi:ASC-1-like (ASCH) protein